MIVREFKKAPTIEIYVTAFSGVLSGFEKKGFAFESSNKLVEVAFSEFGIDTISAITIKDNISSQKLLERLGLKLIGTTKIPNDDEELLLYKIEK